MTQGKVISLGMQEMKWITADLNQIISVKEQRVDGSTIFIKIVKYTLVTEKSALERKKLSNKKLMK
jgi:hypothetical protein